MLFRPIHTSSGFHSGMIRIKKACGWDIAEMERIRHDRNSTERTKEGYSGPLLPYQSGRKPENGKAAGFQRPS
jgi:hypothetical protein